MATRLKPNCAGKRNPFNAVFSRRDGDIPRSRGGRRSGAPPKGGGSDHVVNILPRPKRPAGNRHCGHVTQNKAREKQRRPQNPSDQLDRAAGHVVHDDKGAKAPKQKVKAKRFPALPAGKTVMRRKSGLRGGGATPRRYAITASFWTFAVYAARMTAVSTSITCALNRKKAPRDSNAPVTMNCAPTLLPKVNMGAVISRWSLQIIINSFFS